MPPIVRRSSAVKLAPALRYQRHQRAEVQFQFATNATCCNKRKEGRTVNPSAYAADAGYAQRAGSVRRERRCDPAASGYPDVVLAATLGVQLRPDVHTRIFAAWADTANSQRLAKASSHIPGTAAVDLASDSLDSSTTSRGEPAPPVAPVGSSLGHQALATRTQAWRRSTRLRSSAQVLPIPSTSRR